MVRRLFPLAVFAALLVGLSGGGGVASPVPERQLAAVTPDESTRARADVLDAPNVSLAAAIENVIETRSPVTVAAPSEAPEVVVIPSATPVPVTVVPVAPPQPSVCPPSFFCYPRLGIAGPIVPYDDCQGTADVGTAIRSLTCVSSTYLAAHAYTQFGRIAGWRPGDIVFALGTRFVLVDAFTQPGCAAPARAHDSLSLQTSLTAAHCGPILVVQGVSQTR
jgi:hypothetical protein